MSLQTQPCDPGRIEAFLDQRLSEVEQAEFELHLSDCSDCRASLDAQTAAGELWDKASRYLRDDDGESDGVLDSRASTNRDQGVAVQQVLDALQPTDDPEMLGRLGGHEVSGVVGAGGMGVVLKAVDTSLDRTVAMKVLAPHLACSGAARKRFAREAKAAAAVLHPNVLAIHSVSNDESLPHLIMPYLRGQSLQKRIDDEGPLPVSEILRIGSQIAAGLAAAHAQGLVHRDIKPANILLEDGVERVAITDFGLARAVDDASMSGTSVLAGTPQYMSPEQARGEAIDQRSDLFSLGSVLYVMCTGRTPFRAETTYGVLRRITDGDPRPIRAINADIPQWLCTIVDRLMSKRLADRFDSAEEVAELLEECLAHVQQPTSVPLPATLSVAPTNHRLTSLSLLTVGAIVMIAAFGLTLLGTFFGQVPLDDSGKPAASTMRFEEPTRSVELRGAEGERAVLTFEEPIQGLKLNIELNDGTRVYAWEFSSPRKTKEGKVNGRNFTITFDRPLDGITLPSFLPIAVVDDAAPPAQSVLDAAKRADADAARNRAAARRSANEPLDESAAPTRPLRQIVASPDGSLIAEVRFDIVVIHDATKRSRELQTLKLGAEGKTSVFSPNGSEIGVLTTDGIKYYEVSSGKMLKFSPNESWPQWTDQVAADTRPAVVGNRQRVVSSDGSMIAYLFSRGVEIDETETKKILIIIRSEEEPRAVEFSRDNREVGLVAKDGVRYYDLRSGKILRFDADAKTPTWPRSASIDRTPDRAKAEGARPTSGAATTPVASPLRLETEPTATIDLNADVYSVEFSPDGQLLLAAGGSDVYLIDAKTGSTVRQLDDHTDRVWRATFSPNGDLLASGSRDGTVRVWDVDSDKPVGTYHQGAVRWLMFDPLGEMVAAANDAQSRFTIELWRLDDGEKVKTLLGATASVMEMVFSPSGDALVTAESGAGQLHVWDVRTGRIRWTGRHSRGATAVSFSPDGQTVVSGGWDNTVRFWDSATGKLRRVEVKGEGNSGVESLLWLPGSVWLLGGQRDGVINVIDARAGVIVQSFQAHDGPVFDLHLSPDGLRVVSCGSRDGKLKLWEIVATDSSSGERTKVGRNETLVAALKDALKLEESADQYEPLSTSYCRALDNAISRYQDIHQEYRSQLGGSYAWLYAARCYHKRQNYGRAICILDQLLERPGDGEAWRDLRKQAGELAEIVRPKAGETD